jgi:hypothetical protein
MVFQAQLAEILESRVHAAPDLFVRARGNHDAAGRSNGLEPCGDVDAVAVHVVFLDDDLAEVDADAQHDPAIGRHAGIRGEQLALQFDRGLDRVHRAAEFHQHAVAHQLDDASFVRTHDRLDDRLAALGQHGERAGLVRAHHARITHDIGECNRGEAALDACFRHGLSWSGYERCII